jgi:hypothetical protein
MSDNRDVGVTFGDLQDDLESGAYPLSAETLLDRYGDREVEHTGGAATLRELLDGSSEESYESADEVHQAVLNMVGEEAEGRQGYTDREPNARGEDFEQQSF